MRKAVAPAGCCFTAGCSAAGTIGCIISVGAEHLQKFLSHPYCNKN